MFLPSPLSRRGWGLLPVALVGCQARAFSYALMEKRRLETAFVYAL